MSSSVASSSITSRLERLNGLSHAIERHKGRTASFNALDLKDRTRILGILNIAKFDWTRIEKKGLKGRMIKELRLITEELRTLCTQPTSIFSFPFSKVPKMVMTAITGPYLTAKDLTALHRSCKAASEWETVSHIIKYYHLGPLIETYLHSYCTNLIESGKAKLLDELMTFAYNLSKIEKLPRPAYRSLVEFFKLVEARNLIRMVQRLKIEWRLTSLDKTVKSLGIPKNPKQVIKKAELLKGWFERHQHFLASIKESLNLEDCNLSLLPKELGLLQSVKELLLSDNHLTTLPNQIGQMQAILYLDLTDNQLVTLPREIGFLQSLLHLYLSCNQLVTLPKEIELLQVLTHLDLHNNHITNLPKEIGRLRVLQSLGLNTNRLKFLPEEIGKLQSMEVLCLENNRLISLPKKAGQLKALKSLRIDENGLIDLPKGLGRFNDQLKEQNKKLQLKNLLNQLMLCLKNGHNCKGISVLLGKIEGFLGKGIRSRLEHSLGARCKKAAETNPILQAKFTDPLFSRKAFADKEVDPKLKAKAIAQFWKENVQTRSFFQLTTRSVVFK